MLAHQPSNSSAKCSVCAYVHLHPTQRHGRLVREASLRGVVHGRLQVRARQQVEVAQHDQLRLGVEQRQVARHIDGEQPQPGLQASLNMIMW